MQKEWWFFKNGFMDWIRENFPEPLKNHFTYDLIDNCVEYGLTVTDNPKDFVGMMVKLVPEVTFDEWMEWINK